MSTRLHSTGPKVGLYIDVSNITLNGGYGLQFEVLRQFACRGNAEPMRLNVYLAFDQDRAQADSGYRQRQLNFHSKLRDLGYKVIVKQVKWFTDETGQRVGKSNVDLDLAVDALLQSENMDRIVLATGDGDFVQVVRALQNRGCRVEIVAFDNISGDLRREADLFISGYLIPGLLPIEGASRDRTWGDTGSRVRGVCYARDAQGRSWGFLRYLWTLEGELWKTDGRQEGSPYRSIFCHDNELPPSLRPEDLPSRDIILEFGIAEDEASRGAERRQRAVDVHLVNR